jgi:hypothetical protein
VPSIVTWSRSWPVCRAQVQVGVVEKRRTSWVREPSAVVERVTRIPSGSEERGVPLRRPVTVETGSAAGEKAPVPEVVSRIEAGLPWPRSWKFQPSRPRPTSTQPPPLVSMSQANCCGRIRAAVSSQ